MASLYSIPESLYLDDERKSKYIRSFQQELIKQQEQVQKEQEQRGLPIQPIVKPTKEYVEGLKNKATTLYVGNLSFYTTEEQIYELFSKCGEIKRIIMGLDRNKKTPCGFCFVEYFAHDGADNCMKHLNQTKLDDRIIRTDWDLGFSEGRQYGRGKLGGQIRDEYRADYDAGRGGFGKLETAQNEQPSTNSPVAQRTQQYQQYYNQPPSYPTSQHYQPPSRDYVVPSVSSEHLHTNQGGNNRYNGRKRPFSGDDNHSNSSYKRPRTDDHKNPRFRERREESDDEEMQ